MTNGIPTPSPGRVERRGPIEGIDLNSLRSLDQLIGAGISRNRAEIIFNHIQSGNRLSSVEDLTELGGIGSKTVDTLREAGFIAVAEDSNAGTDEALSEEEDDEAGSEETEPLESESVDEVESRWERIKNRVKGTFSFLTSPFSPAGKGKVGYVTGLALGHAMNIAHASGLGLGLRLAWAGTFNLANLVYERGLRWYKTRGKSPEERQRIEKEFQESMKQIRGVAAGVAATSLLNVVPTRVWDNLWNSSIWQKFKSGFGQNFKKLFGVDPTVGIAKVKQGFESAVMDLKKQVQTGLGQVGSARPRVTTEPMDGPTVTTVPVEGQSPVGHLIDSLETVGIEEGDTVHNLVAGGKTTVGLKKFYTPDYLRAFVSLNADVLEQGNPPENIKAILSGKVLSGGKLTKEGLRTFFDSAHWIYPGQELQFPDPDAVKALQEAAVESK